MKSKNENKRGSSAPKRGPKGKKFSMNNDSFFEAESKKRRKMEDDDIESGESEGEAEILGGSDASGGEEKQDDEDEETPGEIRKRVATELLDKMRAIARKEKEDKDGDDDEEEARDSLVAKILQQEQLEESGRIRRVVGSR